jgi:hypothetical protein
MRNRLLLALAFVFFDAAAFLIWNYLHSPIHAVHRIESAYARQDAAAAAPWLTPQGVRLFQAAIDPDLLTPVNLPHAEAQPPAGKTAVVHYHALTRFGAVDADLRLVRDESNWRLDDVYLHSVGGFTVEAAASSQLGTPPEESR